MYQESAHDESPLETIEIEYGADVDEYELLLGEEKLEVENQRGMGLGAIEGTEQHAEGDEVEDEVNKDIQYVRRIREQAEQEQNRTKRYRFMRRPKATELYCEKCHKTFRHPSKIAEHMRTHTGEKPFACHLCGARFSQHHPLKVHLRTHSGERPYKCSYCEKCFTSVSHCKSHEKIHLRCGDLAHGVPGSCSAPEMVVVDGQLEGMGMGGLEGMLKPTEPLGEQLQPEYQCPVDMCGFTSLNRNEVEDHIDIVHADLQEAVEEQWQQHMGHDEVYVYPDDSTMCGNALTSSSMLPMVEEEVIEEVVEEVEVDDDPSVGNSHHSMKKECDTDGLPLAEIHEDLQNSHATFLSDPYSVPADHFESSSLPSEFGLPPTSHPGGSVPPLPDNVYHEDTDLVVPDLDAGGGQTYEEVDGHLYFQADYVVEAVLDSGVGLTHGDTEFIGHVDDLDVVHDDLKYQMPSTSRDMGPGGREFHEYDEERRTEMGQKNVPQFDSEPNSSRIRVFCDPRPPKRGRQAKYEEYVKSVEPLSEIEIDPKVVALAAPVRQSYPKRPRGSTQRPAKNLDWIIEAVARGVDVDLASPHNRRKAIVHECQYCGRLDKYPSKIEAHMRTHTGEKPYKCEICGMSFAQRTPMRMHVRRHLDQKPFICQIDGCQQRFVSGALLNNHQNLKHFGGHRRHVCLKGCGRTFASARNQRRHEENCHYRMERPFDHEALALAQYAAQEEMYMAQHGRASPNDASAVGDDLIASMEPNFLD